MTRDCLHCKRPFAVDEALDEKIRSRFGQDGHGHLVCPACVLERLGDMYAESVFHMTEDEIEAELREDGVDVEAFSGKVQDILREAMAKRDADPDE